MWCNATDEWCLKFGLFHVLYLPGITHVSESTSHPGRMQESTVSPITALTFSSCALSSDFLEPPSNGYNTQPIQTTFLFIHFWNCLSLWSLCHFTLVTDSSNIFFNIFLPSTLRSTPQSTAPWKFFFIPCFPAGLANIFWNRRVFTLICIANECKT